MTDVEVHQPQTLAVQPHRSEWDIICAQAHVLSQAPGIVPAAYRGKPNEIIAAALFGRTVGFDVATSLRLIHVVEGKPSFAADALVAMVRRAGHSLSGETSAETATARGRRADTGDEMAVTWTLEEARKAGLASKQNWQKYPQSMLWARAVSQLCRMLFADITLGMAYTPDELDPNIPVDAQGHVIDVEEAPDPSAVEAARQREARDATMAEWAKALTGDQAARWSAWKAEHEGWHRSDTGRNDAYIALGGFYSAEQAAAGVEPFDIVDAELVEGEAGDREAPAGGSAVVDATEPADSTSPSAPSAVVDPAPSAGGSSPMAPRPLITRLQMHCQQAQLGDRAARLAWASGELCRDVKSFNALTIDEAEELIDVAKAIEAALNAPAEQPMFESEPA